MYYKIQCKWNIVKGGKSMNELEKIQADNKVLVTDLKQLARN